jgi:hypothetical protein
MTHSPHSAKSIDDKAAKRAVMTDAHRTILNSLKQAQTANDFDIALKDCDRVSPASGQSLREVERYTRAADQAQLAGNAMQRVRNEGSR